MSALPHSYCVDEIEQMFPKAVVEDEAADLSVDFEAPIGGRFVGVARPLP